MANQNAITLAGKFVPVLDAVYQAASCTAVLDGDNALVREGANAHELIVPMMEMDGLADYERNGGYVQGNVKLTNQTIAANFDRGRKLSVDSMDNLETAGLMLMKLASEFERSKVVGELDAFRFASYCAMDGISKTAGTLANGAAVLSAISAASDKMDDDEVPAENRCLFITPVLLGLVRDLDTTKSREILSSFAHIQKVPPRRFYTAIEQYDGTSEGEKTGGYTKAAAGKSLNFMIVQKDAVCQYNKHLSNKVITPDVNQTADGYDYMYRLVSLARVYKNKVAGIAAHYLGT